MDSSYAREVARGVFDFFKKDTSGVKFKDPRGVLLIVDRSFDLVSPLMHDYSYQTLVADLIGIN